MTARPIELPISLAWGKGGYTVQVRLGSREAPLNLVLDSGSSTLAVLPHKYDAGSDLDLVPTALAQAVAYGAGAFAGPVLKSRLRFGSGHHARTLDHVHFALVQSPDPPWQDADGLFGLAYSGLNLAHDARALLPAAGSPGQTTWPWPFTFSDAQDLAVFRQQLLAQAQVQLPPCFTALEAEGLVADCFALSVRRAVVHVRHADASPHELDADPLNRGTLVLGGGDHCTALYEGTLKTMAVVHDQYYNVVLRSVRVGSGIELSVPPLDPQDVAAYLSNAIIDTGSSFLILPADLYQRVCAELGALDPRLPAAIERFNTAFATGGGLPDTDIRHLPWPVLHFRLQGQDGLDVELSLHPSQYWEANALAPGQALLLLRSQIAGWPAQSILGLPLLCGRFVVFDRSVGGHGVIRVASARAT